MSANVLTLLVLAGVGLAVAAFAWWCGAFHWVNRGKVGAYVYWENTRTGERRAQRFGTLYGWVNHDWLDRKVDDPTRSISSSAMRPPSSNR